MSGHTYTFSGIENSYFMGHDVRVTRSDGETVSINRKEGWLAVNVKDDQLYRDIPDEIRKLADDIGEHRVQRTYDAAQEAYWRWADEQLAPAHYFEGVAQMGREGGWLAVSGTKDWEDSVLTAPESIEDADEREEAERNRANFFALTFEAVAEIETFRQEWYQSIRDAHEEFLRTPASFSLSAFPIMEDGRSLDAIASETAPTAAECFRDVARACERWIASEDRYQWEDGHQPQIDLTLEWTPRVPPNCTGHYEQGRLAHDGDTCPVHEP